MYRSINLALVSTAFAMCLWTTTAPPVLAEDAQPRSTLSTGQVRAAFDSAAYHLSEPHTWSWVQPPFTAFHVSAAGSDRVWTVIVYPDVAAADQARLAAAPGQLLTATITNGPRLVVGFGPSVWYGNVAVVQSTESRLEQLYLLHTERDNGVYEVADPSIERPNDAVDLDVQTALENGAVNF